VRVTGSPNPADPYERAVWLAELETAIGEAQELAWRLGTAEGNAEARSLYGQLQALRAELDALRRSGWAGQTIDLPALWPEIFGRGGSA
jgi:hypothetical protein